MTTKSLLCTSVAALLSLSSAKAGLIVRFGFDAPGNSSTNINEVTGWDGTTLAAGGSLNTNVTLSQSMQIAGTFTAGNIADTFHVDNWHSGANDRNSQITANNSVSFTLAANVGYQLDLGTGTGSFSTRLHDHYTGGNGNKMFDRVALLINGVDIGDQTYTPLSTPQTLTWGLGTNALLNGLSSAQAKLFFWDSSNGGNDPLGDPNHGPQWEASEAAYIELNGDITPVPEPATIAFGFGLLGFSLMRRRR